MSDDIRRGPIEVEVRLATDPSGEPAVLLQLPDGFALLKEPDKIDEIADALHANAELLRRTNV